MQKKIIRTIAGVQYNEHSEPLFKKMNLLKLTDIYRLQNIKICTFFPEKYLTQAVEWSLHCIKKHTWTQYPTLHNIETTNMQNPHYCGVKIHKRHGAADLELFDENI